MSKAGDLGSLAGEGKLRAAINAGGTPTYAGADRNGAQPFAPSSEPGAAAKPSERRPARSRIARVKVFPPSLRACLRRVTAIA